MKIITVYLQKANSYGLASSAKKALYDVTFKKPATGVYVIYDLGQPKLKNSLV
jgi:hypothetical protein